MWLEYEFVLLKIEQSYVWEREREKKKIVFPYLMYMLPPWIWIEYVAKN